MTTRVLPAASAELPPRWAARRLLSTAFGSAHSAARRPAESVARARWYSLVLAICATVGTLPPVILSTGSRGARALCVAGLIWLIGHRLVDYRRGRLSRPAWDGLEAGVLLLAAVAVGFEPILALFFFSAWFRAATGTGRRIVAGSALYLGTLVVAGKLDGQATDGVALAALALACATLLIYTSGRALRGSLQQAARLEQLTSRILEAATDAFVETDADGRILHWSAQATSVLGWNPDQVLQRALADVLAPVATRPVGHSLLRRELMVEAGHPARSRVELQVEHRDGSALTVQVSVWTNGSDEDRHVNVLLHDRTEQRRDAARLSEAQARFQQAFHNAPIGMMLAGLDGELLEVNRVFCEMLGRSSAELMAAGITAVTHPEDRAATREALSSVMSGAVGFGWMEKRYLHADGRPVLAHVSLSLTRDAAGQGQFLVAQAEDVTERRATEQALAHQRVFTEAVLDDVDTGIVACDADGLITVFNRAMRRLHGLPAEPMSADAWSDYYDVYCADGVTPMANAETPLFRALRGEQVRDAEMVIAPKGAEPRSLVVNGRPLTGPRGRPLGAVAALHDVTDRRKAEAAISWQALHDPLTGRANRLLLRDRLTHALNRGLRRQESLALLVLDLDGFKAVNDSLGNEAGDLVLVTVADRMREVLRPEDTIARIDGDEFAVVLENTSALDAVRVATELLASVRAPIVTHGRTLKMEASVGLTIGDGDGDPEEILRNASLAMYAAKSTGKGTVQVYDASMHEEVLQQLTLQSELHEAMAGREFTVHYQPVISLISGQVQGFEALVRWNHPICGLLPPNRFIALAESTGLIVPLGSWVLERACSQLRTWHIRHPELGPLTMAVNISVRQLQDPALIETVGAALTKAGLPPHQLILEITESGVMHRGPGLDALNRLHDLGVRLAIDDFGTGYSSLSRLHALPVDQVKIDKSFVDQLSSAQPSPVVAATIAIARSLGLETVAEGVESAEQLPFLRAHGCDHVQGYLFSPPVDAAAIEQLLAGGAGWLAAGGPASSPDVRVDLAAVGSPKGPLNPLV